LTAVATSDEEVGVKIHCGVKMHDEASQRGKDNRKVMKLKSNIHQYLEFSKG
jgi:hypothetical protein